jgi:hypothetical protein
MTNGGQAAAVSCLRSPVLGVSRFARHDSGGAMETAGQ